MADDLVLLIYKATVKFPTEEKYGLVSQMRRAAVSIPSNIVEGCGRRSTADYLNFLNVATGSAYELGYLCGLSGRLEMLATKTAADLQERCNHIAASLTALVESLENADDEGGNPRTTNGKRRNSGRS
jgi:four helix bundle protein